MNPTPRRISAAEFEARCLSLLDEVASTRISLVVTKDWRPIARVVPADDVGPRRLRGSVVREVDVFSPIEPDWDAAS